MYWFNRKPYTRVVDTHTEVNTAELGSFGYNRFSWWVHTHKANLLFGTLMLIVITLIVVVSIQMHQDQCTTDKGSLAAYFLSIVTILGINMLFVWEHTQWRGLSADASKFIGVSGVATQQMSASHKIRTQTEPQDNIQLTQMPQQISDLVTNKGRVDTPRPNDITSDTYVPRRRNPFMPTNQTIVESVVTPIPSTAPAPADSKWTNTLNSVLKSIGDASTTAIKSIGDVIAAVPDAILPDRPSDTPQQNTQPQPMPKEPAQQQNTQQQPMYTAPQQPIQQPMYAAQQPMQQPMYESYPRWPAPRQVINEPYQRWPVPQQLVDEPYRRQSESQFVTQYVSPPQFVQRPSMYDMYPRQY